MKAITIEIHGAVQGVGFRYTTRDRCRQLAIVGWIRNAPDGSVEVWAQGVAEAVTELLTFLEQGPPGAAVTEVVVNDVVADPTLSGFDILG